MSQQVIICGPGEGKTLLVGGSDFVTYKVRSDETNRAYFCFEVSATPGFGPPPHTHAYRELFYVLDGEYEFTFEQDGQMQTLRGTSGTTLAIEPNLAHTFRNVSNFQARLLITHQPAALEEFFEEFGVPVAHAGDIPEDFQPPDDAAMAAALERNGVHVIAHQALT
jgi:quercetin dioxygenase-like cupin family protein